jgi:hypothetical protein
MAYDFAAGTDRIDYGSPSYLDNLSPITISAIVNCDTLIANARIVAKEAPSGFMLLLVNTFGGLQHLTSFSTSGIFTTSANLLTTGNPSVVTSVWNGGTTAASSLFLYVDGVETPTYGSTTNASGSQVDDAAANVFIGNRSALNRGFDGKISEVGIWNAALTQGEIASLGKRFGPRRVRPQNLVFYSPLVRSNQEIRNATAGTTTGPTVANHPRVY